MELNISKTHKNEKTQQPHECFKSIRHCQLNSSCNFLSKMYKFVNFNALVKNLCPMENMAEVMCSPTQLLLLKMLRTFPFSSSLIYFPI